MSPSKSSMGLCDPTEPVSTFIELTLMGVRMPGGSGKSSWVSRLGMPPGKADRATEEAGEEVIEDVSESAGA